MLTGEHRLRVRLDAAGLGARGAEPGLVHHPLVVQLGRRAMLAGRKLMSGRRLLVLAAWGMDGAGHAGLQAEPSGLGRLCEGEHTPLARERIIPDMKRNAMLQAPACLPEMSAEAALQGEIAALGEWLASQGLDLRGDKAHTDEGSRDRLYWRYGYFAGLKQALTMLANRAATLH